MPGPFGRNGGGAMGRAITPTAFVGAAGRREGEAVALTLGTAKPGDIMEILLGATTTVVGGAGDWRYSAQFASSGYRTAAKVLQADDIADGLAVSTTASLSAHGIYRSPLGRTAQRSVLTGDVGGTDAPGFSKAGWSAGLLAFVLMPANSPQSGVAPAGWATRLLIGPVMGGGSNLQSGVALYDLLNPAAYTNGTAIDFGAASGGPFYVSVDELLSY